MTKTAEKKHMSEYWKEVVETAMHESNTKVTDDQMKIISRIITRAHANYDEKEGYSSVKNRIIANMEENEDITKNQTI